MSHLKERCPWAYVEVQLNLKEPFGFGPWLKAESSSKITSQWVEFIANITQSNDEEDEGRKELVAQEQE